MWSLPNINSLNANAKSCATAYNDILAAVRKGGDHEHKCENCGAHADHAELVFDIFSDDAKDLLTLCDSCYNRGADESGNFRCEHCDRLMVENYTWELYRVEMNGETWCAACAAKEYFGDDDNLIDASEIQSVVMDKSKPLFKNGVLNIAKAKHVLCVEQPTPEGVRFLKNWEFDSYTGHQISGCNMLNDLKLLGGEVFIVMDGAYQFACSIAAYRKA